MGYFHFEAIPENLLWGHRQRILDTFNGNGGSIVWLQHVPFDPTANRQELYNLRDESGLSGQEFYMEYFGLGDPDGDRQEIG